MDKKHFEISTSTTGFGSPARAYSEKRLDPNDLLIKDPYTTFFFRWSGEEMCGLKRGDYLVVDRREIPLGEDLVVYSSGDKLSCDFYKNINPDSLWGSITWKLCPLKK
jgi:hypothetical protein